jgi:hypothetical protein
LATKLERFFYALGKGAKAMKDSAEARVPGEAPPVAAPPDQPVCLVRCPKCGGYAPAGQACRCS